MGARQLRLEAFDDDPPRTDGPGAAAPVRTRVDPHVAVERTWLDDTSWIDVGHHWLRGADALFERVTAPGTGLRWEQRRRPMYGRLVDEPRLTAELRLSPGATGRSDPLWRIVDAAAARYGVEASHLWANWYRNGDDAVAWHGDRIGRHHPDPVVVIVSLGGPRRFLVRPAPGRAGTPRAWTLHSGDLLVMGGACQRRWQHSVPRRRGGAARISLTFREPSPTPGDDPAHVAGPTDTHVGRNLTTMS